MTDQTSGISITSWRRLEPRARDESISSSLEARVHDPLWLLGRQWQIGEFHGEDAGSPVRVDLTFDLARLTRYAPGPNDSKLGDRAVEYDSAGMPLEVLVEGESVSRDPSRNSRLTIEAGQHFFRLMGPELARKYKAKYLGHPPYQLAPPSETERKRLDSGSLPFLDLVAGRCVNALALYDDLKKSLSLPPPALPTLPPDPKIDVDDREAILAAAKAWRTWFESLYEIRTEAEAWQSERMEYDFAVSGSFGTIASPGREVVFHAPSYAGDRVEWYRFDVLPDRSLGAPPRDTESQVAVPAIPTPARYSGMPSPRWWEFEDARIGFGTIEAGAQDLSRMLFMEFALIYGNDFFVVPAELPVGVLSSISQMKVTDTFGESFDIGPIAEWSEPKAAWQMFHLSGDGKTGATQARPLLFLPPTAIDRLESSPIEEVMLLRDEMANMAWAVERVVEGRAGRPVRRFEMYQRRMRARKDQGGAPAPGASTIRYRLQSDVPDYWFPLTPVRVPGSERSTRLELATFLDPDGAGMKPEGFLLAPPALQLNEEEVPRAGVRVTRSYRYARWSDGLNSSMDCSTQSGWARGGDKWTPI